MDNNTVLSANVTIKAPIKNVCNFSQLRGYRGREEVTYEVAFKALVAALIEENGLSSMVGQEPVAILEVEMVVAE